MKEIMDFELCKKTHLKSVEPDKAKIASIRLMCKARQKLLAKAELDSETAPVIASDYYEIIKELLVALLLKNGLKSDNHECLISYFKKNYSQYEYEAKAMHQLKEVRNRASYDGVFVKKEYVLSNSLEFKGIIDLLNKLLEED